MLKASISLTLDQRVNLQSTGYNGIIKIRGLHESLCAMVGIDTLRRESCYSLYDTATAHALGESTRGGRGSRSGSGGVADKRSLRRTRLSYENLASLLKSSRDRDKEKEKEKDQRMHGRHGRGAQSQPEYKQSVQDSPDRRDSRYNDLQPDTPRQLALSSTQHAAGAFSQTHFSVPDSNCTNSVETESGVYTNNGYGGDGWETFYEHDGILVSELHRSDASTGVLSAHCNTTLSPAEVRNVLIHYPERVDGLLARRTVLNRLDNETFLQWMGYGPFWPLGLKDFLVVTSEESINDFHDGFVIASTSVDQLCEEIDDIDNAVEEIIGKDMCGRTFQRSTIRISGYVGLPDGQGGTNLTLFVDSDGYEHTPSWLLRLLAQYELCEMMRRIRAIPSLNTCSSGRSTPVGGVGAYPGAPTHRPSYTDGSEEASERERKKAKDLEKLLLAAEGQKRPGVVKTQAAPTQSRFHRVLNRFMGQSGRGNESNASPKPSPRLGYAAAPTDETKKSLLSSVLGRTRSSTKDLSTSTWGLGSTSASSASLSNTSSNASSNARTSPPTSSQHGGSIKGGAGAGALMSKKSTEYTPITRADLVTMVRASEHGDGDDYDHYERESSQESVDNEIIAAFRDHSHLSLVSDAARSAATASPPNRGARGLTFPLSKGVGENIKPGVKEGLEIAGKAFRLMKVYCGLETESSAGLSLQLDWQQKINKRNMTVSSTMVAGSHWQAIRAVTTVAAEKDVVLSLLSNDCRMGEFDDMFDFITPLVKVDSRTAIRRVCCKPVWPTAPRDFLVCTTWKELEDGSIMLCSRSAPDDVLAQQRGCVRGSINISGYWIQPKSVLQPTDPFFADCPADGCKVTLTAHTELGGSLPASVINMLSTAAPMKMLTAIGEIVRVDSLARPSASIRPFQMQMPPTVCSEKDSPPVSSDRERDEGELSASASDCSDTEGDRHCGRDSEGATKENEITPEKILRMLESEHTSSEEFLAISAAAAAAVASGCNGTGSASSSRKGSIQKWSAGPRLSLQGTPKCNAPFVRDGVEIAAMSVRLMQLYLGMAADARGMPSLQLDWQQKIHRRNMTVSSTMVAGSHWQAIRAVTTMAANNMSILGLILDDSRMGEFDDMFDFITPLVKVDSRTAIRRVCCKPVWPTAPRDFLVCTTWKELEDGSIMLCSRSAPDDVLAQQRGYVRGFVNISGYFIQPKSVLQPTDPFFADCPADGCKVTLTAHTELGGSLPASVINMLSTAAPMKMLTAIGDICSRSC